MKAAPTRASPKMSAQRASNKRGRRTILLRGRVLACREQGARAQRRVKNSALVGRSRHGFILALRERKGDEPMRHARTARSDHARDVLVELLGSQLELVRGNNRW